MALSGGLSRKLASRIGGRPRSRERVSPIFPTPCAVKQANAIVIIANDSSTASDLHEQRGAGIPVMTINRRTHIQCAGHDHHRFASICCSLEVLIHPDRTDGVTSG